MLWRKTARIILRLSEKLNISSEMAMDMLYNSHTYELFINPDSGLQLMSDEYVVNDVINEQHPRSA